MGSKDLHKETATLLAAANVNAGTALGALARFSYSSNVLITHLQRGVYYSLGHLHAPS
jgi:hypothetical protein